MPVGAAFGDASGRGVQEREITDEELKERADVEAALERNALHAAEAFSRAKADARPVPDAYAQRPLAGNITEARKPTSGGWVPDPEARRKKAEGAEAKSREAAVAAVLAEAKRRASRKPSRGCGPGGVATSTGAAFKDPRGAKHAIVGQHEGPTYGPVL